MTREERDKAIASIREGLEYQLTWMVDAPAYEADVALHRAKLAALDALIASERQAQEDAVHAMLCWRSECCDGDAAPGMDTDALDRIEQYERDLAAAAAGGGEDG